jgi:hypothetical protein
VNEITEVKYVHYANDINMALTPTYHGIVENLACFPYPTSLIAIYSSQRLSICYA